ncbi:MAG: 3D domain-containing protein [Acidobacteria bacterium]|nr:3D domain-containing protein [Acidobacteriota bacterium]
MAKTLFGGSAVLTGALLFATLTFNASPSVAEHLAADNQQAQTRQTTKTTGAGLPAETASVAALPADPAPPAPAGEAATPPTPNDPAAVASPVAGAAEAAAAQKFTATAYALRGRTASGAGVRRGLIAADRRVLPLGSRVRLEAGAYSGEYLVADRGGAVRGRIIDIWVPTTREAMRFGRRAVKLTVLSYGAKPATRPARPRR